MQLSASHPPSLASEQSRRHSCAKTRDTRIFVAGRSCDTRTTSPSSAGSGLADRSDCREDVLRGHLARGKSLQQPCAPGKGFRRDYALGDAARCPSHMILESTPGRALEAVRSLNLHDFAFVRRTDGSFSYAILVHRSRDSKRTDEECLAFAISGGGSLKIVRQKSWGDVVRRVREPALKSLRSCRDLTTLRSCRETETEDAAWRPPSVISFTPENSKDDVSVMSSVSAQARDGRRVLHRGYTR